MIGLVLCWFLIPYYGVGGTILSYGIYCLIQILFYYLYYWPKKMNLNSKKIFLSSFLPSLLTGILSVIICRIFIIKFCNNFPIIISFFIGGSMFLILYVTIIWTICLSKDDKNFFTKLVRK